MVDKNTLLGTVDRNNNDLDTKRREISEMSSSSSSSSEKSEIRSAIKELSMMANLKPSDTHIPFKPFISICKLVLQVLDNIGPTMAVLRQDIHQNIQRLEMVHESDRTKYSNMVEVLRKEATQGNAKTLDSSSKAFLWLTRSLDFTVALLQNFSTRGSDASMDKIVEDSYNSTLKKWHGWISSTAVKVALKLVPDHKAFVNALMAKEDQSWDSIKDQMQIFISLLLPLLEVIHSCLKAHGLDRLKST